MGINIDTSLGSRPLMPHYLGELMAFQVKQTSFLILLSMWVTAMLTIMSLGAALVLYNMVRYDPSKKGGNAPRGLRIKRARDDYVSYLILRKSHYWGGTKTTTALISPVLHPRSATTTGVTIPRQIIIIY